MQIYNNYLPNATLIGIENSLKCKYGMATSSYPTLPLGLAASAGNLEVSLEWADVSGTTSYNVWRSTNNTASYQLIAPGLPTAVPLRDPLKSRPPKSLGFGKVFERGEMLSSHLDEFSRRIGRQIVGKALAEFAEHGMDEIAALCSARRGVDLVEGRQTQDVLGVNRIGIAQPVFDLGHRQALGPHRKRRFRCRARRR